jgi:hypothetical protein
VESDGTAGVESSGGASISRSICFCSRVAISRNKLKEREIVFHDVWMLGDELASPKAKTGNPYMYAHNDGVVS